MSLTEADNKTQITSDHRHASVSTFNVSFRKNDLRHGWPPGLSVSTSPFHPPTSKHTQMLMLGGIKQTWQPGPLCGVGFLAELGLALQSELSVVTTV